MSFIPSPEFGPFIKHFLESKHRSKSYVEKQTGIRRKTLDRWERGDAQRIQDGTLEEFAKCFNLTVEDFIKKFEAYKESIASDTAQATIGPPTHDEIITSIPMDPTETTGPSRNKGKLISIVSSSLLIAFVLIGGTYAFINSPRINDIKPSFISGNVSCANNQPVAGVWVDVFKGSAVDKRISGAAAVQNLNSNGSKVHFAFLLKGDAYNLHVGCGWSGKEWKAKDYTEAGSGPVYDRNIHSFTCHDIPSMNGHGLCDLSY